MAGEVGEPVAVGEQEEEVRRLVGEAEAVGERGDHAAALVLREERGSRGVSRSSGEAASALPRASRPVDHCST